MKNIKKPTKRNEENIIKILRNKNTIAPRLSQLTNENRYNTISLKEPITHKEIFINNNKGNNKFTKKKINKKLFLIPNYNTNTKKNNKEIIKKNLLKPNIDLDISDINKQKIFIFPIKGIKNDNDVTYKQKNHSVENDNNRIYVHKKLKSFNNKILTTRNNNNINEIKYENTFCQTNRNKDYYSKLFIFPNKDNSQSYRKKNLSELDVINSSKNDGITNLKFFNKSPNTRNRKSFLNFPTDINNNTEENIRQFNTTESKDITFGNDVPDDDMDDRLDNINDYINIYSINNKSVQNENNKTYDDNKKPFEEDKIIIKKKSNNKKNKNIIINTNKKNNINDLENKEKKNTININKNIIINKKIILIPDDKNSNNDNCSKTSYRFFNTYTNKYKNVINIPYSNVTENYINQNINYNNIDSFGHSHTKTTLNNFIYKKKSLLSPSPKYLRYISFFTENNNSKSNKNIKNRNINNNQSMEPQMSNTLNKFYGPKKIYNNFECLQNLTIGNNCNERKTIPYYAYNNNNIKIGLRKGKKNDIYQNFTSMNKNIKNSFKNKNKNNNNKNILIINENEDNLKVDNIKLSIIEKSNILEKQFKLILNKILKYQNCKNECYQFIHFYLENYFYQDIIQQFNNIKNKEIIIKYIKMEIIFLFLCYDILCGKKFNKACIILKTIISLIYDNFILSLLLIIKNNKNEDKDIINNLNIIVNEYISKKNIFKNNNNINENTIIKIETNNINDCMNYYKMLIDSLYKKFYNDKDYSIKFPNCIKIIDKEKKDLNKIKNIISSFFNECYNKIQNYEFDDLKKFFYSFLSNENKKISSNKNDIKIKQNKLNKNKEKNLYINKDFILSPIKNNCKYTLILNLNETLIYFNNQNTLILRPYLHEFLHEMKLIYEIILFSNKSKEYVEPIINIIQKKEKYFSYIFYNKYIIGDNKGDKNTDLNLLGRDLKNLVIIDYMDNFYKLNKDNVICIKSFYGDVNNDDNILKLLGNFLKELQKDTEKTGDMRISLNKLKYKLYPKIVNNLD